MSSSTGIAGIGTRRGNPGPSTGDVAVSLLAMRFGRDQGRLPPVGPLAVAGGLRAAGYSWTLVDVAVETTCDAFSLDAFSELLLEQPGAVLGVGVFHDAVPLLIAALERVGSALARKRVILGGPGVLGLERELLARLPAVEAVVTGEAEALFPRLLAGAPGSVRAPGVYTQWHVGGPSLARSREALALDALPDVPWEWCRGRRYERAPLVTARGCPFACTFCEVETLTGRQVRRRDIGLVLDELERTVRAVQTPRVQVLDDTFTLSKPRVLAFCDALLNRGLDVTFEAYCRPGTVDVETLQRLAAAGCRRLYFGIDAGDDRLLARVSRGVTVDDAIRVMRMASRYLEPVVSTMWGYPFESLDEFSSSLDMLDRLGRMGENYPIRSSLHLLQPSVSTPLFREYADALVLSEAALERQGAPHAQPVLDVIQKSHRLGAAFFRYDSPSFSTKLERLRSFRKGQSETVA